MLKPIYIMDFKQITIDQYIIELTAYFKSRNDSRDQLYHYDRACVLDLLLRTFGCNSDDIDEYTSQARIQSKS